MASRPKKRNMCTPNAAAEPRPRPKRGGVPALTHSHRADRMRGRPMPPKTVGGKAFDGPALDVDRQAYITIVAMGRTGDKSTPITQQPARPWWYGPPSTAPSLTWPRTPAGGPRPPTVADHDDDGPQMPMRPRKRQVLARPILW